MAHQIGDTITEAAGKAGWLARAACHEFDSALFFPNRPAYRRNDVAAAKAICCRCPVREECLEAAMDGGEKTGIWGGLTPFERMNLRRRRRRARAVLKEPGGAK
jgi:WhiB family redox-sensing transcriptional regulator